MSDDLYQQAIIDLAKKSRALSRLEASDRSITLDNPLCGDRVTLDLRIEGSIIAAFGHKIRGCLLCEASSCLINEHIIGRTADSLVIELPKIVSGVGDESLPMEALWPGLSALSPVRAFKSRHECVTLPFQALIKLLAKPG